VESLIFHRTLSGAAMGVETIGMGAKAETPALPPFPLPPEQLLLSLLPIEVSLLF
jgi:hypothetical protein